MKPTMPLNKIHGMTIEQANEIYKKTQQFRKKKLSSEDQAKLRLLLENNSIGVGSLSDSTKANTSCNPIKMLMQSISKFYSRLIK